jgi:hypothetical protein
MRRRLNLSCIAPKYRSLDDPHLDMARDRGDEPILTLLASPHDEWVLVYEAMGPNLRHGFRKPRNVQCSVEIRLTDCHRTVVRAFPSLLGTKISNILCKLQPLHLRYYRLGVLGMARSSPTRNALWLLVWLISDFITLVSGQWGPVSQVGGVDMYQATRVQVRLQLLTLTHHG